MTKLTLDEAVSRFGASAKDKLSSPTITGEPEDQLRAPFETLLADIAALVGMAGEIVAIGETRLSELQIRPDYSVTALQALVGFIEIKAPGKGADPRKFKDKHDKGQWSKLKQLPNLIYTDGNSFSLWRDGELVGSIVHLDGDIESSGAKLGSNPELQTLFTSFFQWKPIPPSSVKELAVIVARLCRLLRDEVVEQIEQKSPVFTGLAEDWRKMLFPDATDIRFADGYAQAVTFGLLMARAQGVSVDKGVEPVAKALHGTNSLIGTALQLLVSNQENQRAVKTSLSTLTRVLDVVDWKKLSKGNTDAWLYFYEDFLEIYDNDLRKLTGSYYTPPEVVGAMVTWVDELLRSPAYKLPLGLSSTNVNLIDPATGTGTYLLGILRHITNQVKASQGAGAVPGAIHAALSRLNGFELQLGPYAVAQLRLLGEVIDITAKSPTKPLNLFITDTLANPHDDEGWIPQLFKPIAESRRAANKVKRETPVTVVIGNPPYKEKAKGKGGWIETGDKIGEIAPLLDAWQPPKEWGAGLHAKHLRNLYIYFWRWASWKVWDHGPDNRQGIVCYITVAGFINGPGFQMMRQYLRETCDDIWVIDCSPEGYQPMVGSRIFQGVQQEVCIVLASRSAQASAENPARVRFRKLVDGARAKKFADLASISLYDNHWIDCPTDGRSPFLPESSNVWASFPALDSFFIYNGSGCQAKRTWVISPDAESLVSRWNALVAAPVEQKEKLFVPTLRNGVPADRHVNSVLQDHLPGHPHRLIKLVDEVGESVPAVRYGWRSFDREWIIPDMRLITQPTAPLWRSASTAQVYITALNTVSPSNGPAITMTGLVPDLHHYKGSFGGRVYPLWSNAEATESNVSPRLLAHLSNVFKKTVNADDVVAYIAAVAAHGNYTERFKSDLTTPGLRIPLTSDAKTFDETVSLGKRIIWLHTYGERMADASDGRPVGAPRVASNPPSMPFEGAIPPDAPLPDEISYNTDERRIYVAGGYIANVSPEVWAYEVAGKNIITQWFSYRRLTRTKPKMGDKRPPSLLEKIQPEIWPAEYTSDLIDLLNVLTLVIESEPKQKDILETICKGPLVSEEDLRNAGVGGDGEAAPVKGSHIGQLF